MNKFVLVIILLSTVACANRGYDSLAQEVPELFLDIDKSKYVKLTLPNNTVYIDKNLPSQEQQITDFNEENYLKKQKLNSYNYYIPKNRVPSSVSLNLFSDYKRIKSSYNPNTDALLID